MRHKRNTSGLKINAEKKKEAAIKKTDEAIRRLVKKQMPINFNTVSEEASVSKAWLYREESIAERIKRLRVQESPKSAKASDSSAKPSDASKDALLTTLKDRVKELETENKNLKEQIEVLYGRLHDLSL